MKTSSVFWSSVAIGCFVLVGCAKDEPPPEPDAAVTEAETPEPPKPPLEVSTASDTTAAANADLLEQLPFDDRQDFEDAKRGLLAQIPDGVIKGADGTPVWDLGRFKFLEGTAPGTSNPSLWRQGQLITLHGLFEVVDGIYQLRGYDLSNMTLIRGRRGWIVIDPLISKETAAAALALANEALGERPVTAVIYTHSHIDHFGGVHGVVNQADVASGKVKIIAPQHFTENAIAENVLGGNTMSRRASYMYGNLVPPGPSGMMTAGLGPTTSTGEPGLIVPTDIIKKTGEKRTIDGVQIVFQMAPNSEAPSEMLFYFPRFKALCTAEDATHTLHNLYTLRGAKVRDALLWSKYLNEAIDLFGDAEVSFASHHWPQWGNDRVVRHLELQRDLYRYIHDQTLRLANHGYTMIEIAEMIELPDALANEFTNRDYYGTVNHNVKATYQRYFGWFDGNPANLHALPPADAAKKYVEYMGGADAILGKARESYDKGEYRWVGTVVNHVVFADPDNQEARELLAAAYEQMGFQAESGPWRNFYLTGATELREGVKQLPTPDTASPDLINNMSLDLALDYLAMRLNGPTAADHRYTFNAEITDKKVKFVLHMENGVLNYWIGRHADVADATVKITSEALARINLGRSTFADEVKAGNASVEGDEGEWNHFLSMLDTFEFWFNIVTP